MTVEVIGIDHVYVTVRDLRRSEGFYDRVMPILGFRRKGQADKGVDHTSTSTIGSSSIH
jgi:glyoxylase I family protein